MMQNYMREANNNKMQQSLTFAEGVVPKNKDYSAFTQEVTQPTHFE